MQLFFLFCVIQNNMDKILIAYTMSLKVSPKYLFKDFQDKSNIRPEKVIFLILN